MKIHSLGTSALAATLMLTLILHPITIHAQPPAPCETDKTGIAQLRKQVSPFRSPLFKTWLWYYQDWAAQQPGAFKVFQAYSNSKIGKTAKRLRVAAFTVGVLGIFGSGKILIDATLPKEIGPYMYMVWGATGGILLLVFSKYADIYQGVLRRVSYRNLSFNPLWPHSPVLNPEFRSIFFRDNEAAATYEQYGRGVFAQALFITAGYWNNPNWSDEIKVAKVLKQIFRAYQAFPPDILFQELISEFLFPRPLPSPPFAPFNGEAVLTYLRQADPDYSKYELLYKEVIRLIIEAEMKL